MNLKKALKSARKAGRKIDNYRRAAQDVGTFGASEAVGRQLGGRLDARTLIGRTGFGGGPPKTHTVRPLPGTVEETKGLPGTLGRGGACAMIDTKDGSTKRPYSYTGRITLAAGAQAINTDLGDFLDAANGDDIAVDNVVPFGVSIDQASMWIGSSMIAAAIEHLGNLGGLYVIFRINGVEEARWPIQKFQAAFSTAAISCGVGMNLEYDPIPFAIEFDPDKTYELALRTTKAFTTVGVVELALALEGVR